jgi:hypothetical protein
MRKKPWFCKKIFSLILPLLELIAEIANLTHNFFNMFKRIGSHQLPV